MSPFRLALRVLRVDRRTRTSAILTAAGVAVATALMLLLVSLPLATDARADRIAWQEPAYGVTPEEATLAVATTEDFYQGRRIVRVEVAALTDPARIALPDGIERLPGPGEVLLSPELAGLVADRPGSVLGDRFEGEIVGTLGTEALTDPGQLVALVGHAEPEPSSYLVEQEGFATSALVRDVNLDVLAGVGVVVLMVPSLVLVASAARLTAARRETRLAALRLAGATPRQVVAAVAGEMAIAAVGGALLGLALSPPLHSVARHVPWDGNAWQAGDFALPVPVSVSVALAIPVFVLLSAVVGLRRVVRAPLGAANRHARG
ncbi:FtsX-like permease family protein, partial [Saccharomonospora saliphila]|uniref:FtsX-like permease family protein n=1 Tax=Saccharomonospora saliphila TaxID=369829 RepID=UPI00037DC039